MAERHADTHSDPFNFSFSDTQKQLFAGWRRPAELLRTDGAATSDDAAMAVPGEYDLVQDVTTDCSVVSSLCAGMRRLGRHTDPVSSGSPGPTRPAT